MFLDHQDEVGLSVFKHQTASVESNLSKHENIESFNVQSINSYLEVNAAGVAFSIEDATTILVLRVALDVQDAVESGVSDVDVRLNTIR